MRKNLTLYEVLVNYLNALKEFYTAIIKESDENLYKLRGCWSEWILWLAVQKAKLTGKWY